MSRKQTGAWTHKSCKSKMMQCVLLWQKRDAVSSSCQVRHKQHYQVHRSMLSKLTHEKVAGNHRKHKQGLCSQQQLKQKVLACQEDLSNRLSALRAVLREEVSSCLAARNTKPITVAHTCKPVVNVVMWSLTMDNYACHKLEATYRRCSRGT